MSEISSLIQSVSEISADIRAEVVVGNLLECGSLSENQYIVHKEGQFARTYRRDILSSEEIDFDPWQRSGYDDKGIQATARTAETS